MHKRIDIRLERVRIQNSRNLWPALALYFMCEQGANFPHIHSFFLPIIQSFIFRGSGQTKQFFGRKAETENDPPQKAKILAETKFRPKD